MDASNDDDTFTILSEQDKDKPPFASNSFSLRNTIKTKYKKTRANLKSAGLIPERRHRDDYEDLDKGDSSQSDSNLVVGTTENIESALETDAYTTSGSSSNPESVIRLGDNQSKANLTASPLQLTTTASPSWRIIPPNVVIRDRERIRREHVWFIFFVFLFSMYLIIGGLCFQAIESPMEQNVTGKVRQIKNSFLQKYPQIYDEDLEEFLEAIIGANDRGISPLRNASNELNWSFGQALLFSSTVVTTIGYGHVTPLSHTGKIFCMIYAAIGIPLYLVLTTAIVERLLIPSNWLLGTLNSKLGHLYQPFNIRLLHLCIVVGILVFIFFAIPTSVFAYMEPEWGTLDAFYYCFISLTTVGLGDYVPGDAVAPENSSLYKICITCYLVLGVIAVMFALSLFYDIPQLNLGQLFTENLNGETEKLRLSSNNTTCYSGPSGLYMPQRDEEVRRAVVRIRPHGDESPSPDDPPSSNNRDMRIP